MTTNPQAALTLGPVYYLWDGPKWRDFYFRIADEAPVEHVTLGETVCSKRQHFTEPHLAEVVERLESAGKRVALSTLAMVTLERESCWFPRGTEPVFPPRSEPPLSMVF